MVSPSMSSCEHTLNTLRYAYQVKELDVDGTGAATPLDNAQLMLPPRYIYQIHHLIGRLKVINHQHFAN